MNLYKHLTKEIRFCCKNLAVVVNTQFGILSSHSIGGEERGGGSSSGGIFRRRSFCGGFGGTSRTP